MRNIKIELMTVRVKKKKKLQSILSETKFDKN